MASALGVVQMCIRDRKEAKELVDTAPKPVKEGVSKEDADKMVAQLKEVGADVEAK